MVVSDGSIFKRRSDKVTANLAIARDDLWNLSSVKYGSHRFFQLKSGDNLHYLERRSSDVAAQSDASFRNLVIFLHGFPDSWALWKEYLDLAEHVRSTCFIALDLPSHGGSDNLKSYDPDVYLEAMVEFILAMRGRYLSENDPGSKALIAGHDWGAVIAYRLAAEAPQLASRLIVSNSVLSGHARANVSERCSSALQMAKTWLHRLSSSPVHTLLHELRLLRTALSTISPVLRQLFLSHYIAIFHLPAPFPSIYARLGDFWFYRVIHLHTFPHDRPPYSTTQSALTLAGALGPSPAECATANAEHATYGPSVRARARAADAGFHEKIRIYRGGLAAGRWARSLQTLAALQELENAAAERDASSPRRRRRRSSAGFGGGLFEDGPVGAVKAPCTVIWGSGDLALEPRICLDGIGAYLGIRGSQVIVLPKGGHWALVREDGRRLVSECLLWSLEGEESDLKDRVNGLGLGAKVTVDQ
ncbi:MAG: hypothetical protein M1821_006739 [Bathelium mastoideum]|nr:MAG: hypothetical protein M1821_006739 [Bathelium mastoideum]